MKVRLRGLRGLARQLLTEMESFDELLRTAEEEGGAETAAPYLRVVREFQLDFDRPLNFYEEVRRFETALIGRALLRAGGNQRQAAALLSLKPTTLSSKIKSYHIRLDEQEGPQQPRHLPPGQDAADSRRTNDGLSCR